MSQISRKALKNPRAEPIRHVMTRRDRNITRRNDSTAKSGVEKKSLEDRRLEVCQFLYTPNMASRRFEHVCDCVSIFPSPLKHQTQTNCIGKRKHSDFESERLTRLLAFKRKEDSSFTHIKREAGV
jgi:hypothetical protein